MSTHDNHGIVIRLDIPPDHHPGMIKGESPGANTGRAALTAIYDATGKINDTASRVQDKGRLAQAAQPFAERAVQSAGRAMTTLRAQLEHLDKEIAQALKAPVAPDVASQVRAHWAKSPGAKTLSGLREAIESGDITTASAVLHAPAYLSGLDDKQQALVRTMAASKFAPDRVQARAEAAAALARVERATEHFMETIAGRLREWKDEDSKIIAEGLGNG